MTKYIPILFLTFTLAACSIDDEKVETRADGLTYFKESDNLVSGTVTSKFEKGGIASKTKYRKGKETGKWYCYGYHGEYILEGEAIEYPQKIIREFPDFDLGNLTLSFVIEGAQLPYDCRINILESTPNIQFPELVKFANTIYSEFADKYKFDQMYIQHGNFDYRFRKLPVNINNCSVDTIDNIDDKLINIH